MSQYPLINFLSNFFQLQNSARFFLTSGSTKSNNRFKLYFRNLCTLIYSCDFFINSIKFRKIKHCTKNYWSANWPLTLLIARDKIFFFSSPDSGDRPTTDITVLQLSRELRLNAGTGRATAFIESVSRLWKSFGMSVEFLNERILEKDQREVRPILTL